MPDSGIWRQQQDVLRAKFPDVRITSTYRPGSRTRANNNLSNHALGRAIDFEPSMQMFEWIRENYPNSLELIFSPAGTRQIRKGEPHLYSGDTREDHFDHVHWAVDSLANAALPGGAGDQQGGTNPFIPDEIEELYGVYKQVQAVVQFFSDPGAWMRVAIAIGGAALLIAAFMAMNRKTLDLTKVVSR